jgi:hypothetical protein
MLDVKLVGETELIAKFGLAGSLMMARVERGVVESQLRLEAIIKEQKLSGQVLNRVTGNLRASIHSAPVERTATSVQGAVYSGTEVKHYALIHEFGYDGDEEVKEHMRTVVFGRTVAPFTVPAFTRHMHMPERSYMRSTFREQRQWIIERIDRAVAEGIRT